MTKIRVMIVEDSRVVRELLRHLIGCDPRLEVVAAVASAEEALRLLEKVAPGVISMDIRLPGMNGFEATQQIMARKPTPIVVVSASVEADDLKISMNALRAGALAVVEKPVGVSHEDYQAVAQRLCAQLVNMSQVKVVGQRFRRDLGLSRKGPTPPRPDVGRPLPCGPLRFLGLVASTGGPSALAQLLSQLPREFPLPILLVQHMTAGFLEGFAAWLSTVGPFSSRFARDGDIPAPGTLYLPPADYHLLLEGERLALGRGAHVCLQRPSGTVLFDSMARSQGPASVGVLLTGMGEDGAVGLKALRDAGGTTIAEDESTAVVYGMPGVANRIGAAGESLPLPDIAPRLLELVSAREVS